MFVIHISYLIHIIVHFELQSYAMSRDALPAMKIEFLKSSS